MLPRLTPLTDLGRPAAQAYADRYGPGPQGDPLTPEGAGAAMVELLSAPAAAAYLLTAAGLRPLP